MGYYMVKGFRETQEATARAIALRKKKAEQFVEYLAVGIATTILAVLIVYGIVLYMKNFR